MKTLSFAFLVALYLVITHINCGIESSYLKRAEGGRNGSGVGLVEVHVKPPLASPFVDDEEKGKTCVKNMTRCLQDGTYNLQTNKIFLRDDMAHCQVSLDHNERDKLRCNAKNVHLCAVKVQMNLKRCLSRAMGERTVFFCRSVSSRDDQGSFEKAFSGDATLRPQHSGGSRQTMQERQSEVRQRTKAL